MWGWWGAGKDKEPRTAPVTLHVYDLGPTVAGVNVLLGAVGTGAFHAGVEVYGTEWSFGCCSDGPYGSGIFCVPPKGCDAHVYREAVAMGETQLSKREVDNLIDKLAREWPGRSYDLLRHNCCHFSDEFCKRLGVDPVPAWVLSLAGVGAMLRSAVRIGGGAVAGAAAAVMEGAAYAVENLPAALPQENAAPSGPSPATPPKDGPRARPAEPETSPFTCQMPAPGSRGAGSPGLELTGLGGGLGRGLGAGLRAAGLGAGLGGALLGPPAEFEGEEVRRAVPSRGSAFVPAPRRPSSGAGGALERLAEAAGAEPGEGDVGRLAAGDCVEVYSNSHSAWCPGRVESVDEKGTATVTFRLPGAGPNELATKVLPAGHKHLRRARGEAEGPATKQAEPEQALVKGDLVEIFSNSKQVWCPGHVESVHGIMLKVAFQLPGFADGELAHKELPADHKDVRRRGHEVRAEAEEAPFRRSRTGPLENGRGPGGGGEGPSRGYRRGATVHGLIPEREPTREPAGTEADPPEVQPQDGELYRVGDWVEVFTNTHQTWCLGRVTQAEVGGRAHVVFQLPGASADEWVVKKLQPGCKDLRHAAVTTSSAALGTLEPAWNAEEEVAYRQRFEALLVSAAESGQADGTCVGDTALAAFLRTSGLPRRALKEIWQVANPAGKAMLGLAEFSICCRLIGQCQSRSWERADVLADGGEQLRRLLETELLQTPPTKLAEFKGR